MKRDSHGIYREVSPFKVFKDGGRGDLRAMSGSGVSLGSRHSQLAADATLEIELRCTRAGVKVYLFGPEAGNLAFGLSSAVLLLAAARLDLSEDFLDVALQYEIQVADSLMAVGQIANGATHQVEIQALRRGEAAELVNDLKLFR